MDGDLTVDISVTDGSKYAITTSVQVTDATGTNDEGPHTLRRIIPVTSSTSDADHIAIADLAGLEVFNMVESTALAMNACDGTPNNVSLMSAAGTVSGTCDIAMGMIIIEVSSTLEKTMHGLTPNSWNGTSISKQLNVVNWESTGATDGLDAVASYGRLYRPIDSTAPAVGSIALRIYPDYNVYGEVASQLRIAAVADSTSGDDLAESKMDFYASFGTGSAKTRDHIAESTHSVTDTLTVNGSVNESLDWKNSSHGSVSIGINLGQNANGKLGAVIQLNKANGTGIVRTRYRFDLSAISSEDISGKTFTLTDFVFDESGTVTFNADGTVIDATNSTVPEAFTWEIASAVTSNEITSGGT